MSSLNFNHHFPFEKTIQLYGDRAGGQGNFEFAGFAQLKEAKIVLLKGNTESLKQPADWRRFLRLINLAQRLQKPLLLWNLPLVHIATIQHPTSLALGNAIQNTKLQLLKLPQPIITFFDGNYEWNELIRELGWADGSIIVKPEDGSIIVKPEKEKLSALSKLKRQNLKIVREQDDGPQQILDLLQEVSKISREELVVTRLESFSLSVENQR
ncbi:hypothetical protein C6501_12425 [Candidatus Poribacteria bacterium]|nr:MAG: hypothetical protein C6501_12425 [Candidatus Poribacteria bacterium]